MNMQKTTKTTKTTLPNNTMFVTRCTPLRYKVNGRENVPMFQQRLIPLRYRVKD